MDVTATKREILECIVSGNHDKARDLYHGLLKWRADEGGFIHANILDSIEYAFEDGYWARARLKEMRARRRRY